MPRKANPETAKKTGITVNKPKTVLVDYIGADDSTILTVRVDEDGTLSLHPASANGMYLNADQLRDLRRRISQSLNNK